MTHGPKSCQDCGAPTDGLTRCERCLAEFRQRREQARADCARHGHVWTLLYDDLDWYDGKTYRCDRCEQIAYCCLDGPEGPTYTDPEHNPFFLAIGHEWLIEPPPAAPCASRRAECVRCHLVHTRWSDVDHDWVNDNPNPSLSDPEWAMAFGLVDWTGTRRCTRCGVSEYTNPSW
jgi:hypothetical protein